VPAPRGDGLPHSLAIAISSAGAIDSADSDASTGSLVRRGATGKRAIGTRPRHRPFQHGNAIFSIMVCFHDEGGRRRSLIGTDARTCDAGKKTDGGRQGSLPSSRMLKGNAGIHTRRYYESGPGRSSCARRTSAGLLRQKTMTAAFMSGAANCGENCGRSGPCICALLTMPRNFSLLDAVMARYGRPQRLFGTRSMMPERPHTRCGFFLDRLGRGSYSRSIGVKIGGPRPTARGTRQEFSAVGVEVFGALGSQDLDGRGFGTVRRGISGRASKLHFANQDGPLPGPGGPQRARRPRWAMSLRPGRNPGRKKWRCVGSEGHAPARTAWLGR